MGLYTFKQITSEAEIRAAARIGSLAYPGFKLYSDESLATFTSSMLVRYGVDASAEMKGYQQLFGGFDGEALVAHYVVRTFGVSLFGQVHKMGGLSFVAVDVLRKKQGVAKALVSNYLASCFDNNQFLAALYPFRPDFYLKMGFGLSTPFYDYTIPPAAFPLAPRKAVTPPSHSVLEHLDPAHVNEIVECQNRFATLNHGQFHRNAINYNEVAFRDKGETRVLGYRDEDRVLRGFLVFKFKATDKGLIINDLEVLEFIHESTPAFFALSKFLNQQADQIRHILLSSQNPEFYRLLSDPRAGDALHDLRGLSHASRETSVQATGIMYRVVNLEKLLSVTFKERNYNGVDGLKLMIRMEDSLTPEMNPPVLVEFVKGKCVVLDVGAHVLEVAVGGAVALLDIDVSEFSALIVGAVSLLTLVDYGKAVVEPQDKLALVKKAFWVEKAPVNSVFF
ncbi:UNVERIFIED_CONTAM: hypothetical protein HDU68_003857 [Siphonaria sp. JEL0065]|nr:hypothetical protein HDU68_003857 [Siphonaria sp. JEL0065]